MEAVAPKLSEKEIMYAEGQPQYVPVRVAITPAAPEYGPQARYLVTRWAFSDEERRQIAAGEDIYVAQLNWGNPMTPILVGLRELWTSGAAAVGAGE
jgi:hypothetical protein